MIGHNWRAGTIFFLSSLLCVSPLLGQTARAAALDAERLVPVGHTVGIKLFAEGVVVIGLAEVDTAAGVLTPGADCGLRVGDVIEAANGKPVDSSEQFASLLQCGGVVKLDVSRDGEDLTLAARPVLGDDGTYRLGAWIRDSMAGIGTVTFYDPVTGTFGALGHGINDVDTALLMPLDSGSILPATVAGVEKGKAGDPGQLQGVFDTDSTLGLLSANTDGGVFGVMADSGWVEGAPVEAAVRDEVEPGEATILSNISGQRVEEYAIRIEKVFPQREDDCRDYLLKVTDPRLLEATGGIVQGMSGSPILQNGKIVGAVTHVLVDDPTSGYGIWVGRMLQQCDN